HTVGSASCVHAIAEVNRAYLVNTDRKLRGVPHVSSIHVKDRSKLFVPIEQHSEVVVETLWHNHNEGCTLRFTFHNPKMHVDWAGRADTVDQQCDRAGCTVLFYDLREGG